ncbi:hypothetical protein K503DRAFT_441091 [Rhizopogon vinicolor AM-OR11-026]|uniref:Uncharacterized protein n=1 Tax=Rhizopogon vinicolor AM-OR11-026 TaxID=1314800 RepID=A0A1B7MPC5_9AGAM|nr:hypothetical protein K503DRAFT_441091 [Rhizopogon vinicolor AM-OR11-026]
MRGSLLQALVAVLTEAGLNAIPRYTSSMIIIFSSLRPKSHPIFARSSSSSPSQLSTQLVYLLLDTLRKVKDATNKVFPVSKKHAALEEVMVVRGMLLNGNYSCSPLRPYECIDRD